MISLIHLDNIQNFTCRLLSKQLSVLLFLHHPLELESEFDSNKRKLISIYSGIALIELEGTKEISSLKSMNSLEMWEKNIVCMHMPLKRGFIHKF